MSLKNQIAKFDSKLKILSDKNTELLDAQKELETTCNACHELQTECSKMADSIVLKFGHDPQVMLANLMFFGIKQVVMVHCRTLELSNDIGSYSKYIYGYLLVWLESLRDDDQLQECKTVFS